MPCTHLVQDHPGGHPNPIPGLPNIPCVHMHLEHPNGDTITTACIHLMPVVRRVPELNLVF